MDDEYRYAHELSETEKGFWICLKMVLQDEVWNKEKRLKYYEQ
jgi:hypothetical protein